ncbi:MAG: RagB/SusD family nutrient uptake outer membrane protein [Flavobacteriaceae bacterium]|nr:RagB/SusD family nutrient uptake outer membrane protein [Flavobacteriaceae bacterium]
MNKKLSIVLGLFFLITSCELTDVLDNDPPNNLVSENVVQNQDDAKALLNGAYSRLVSRTSNAYYELIEEIPSTLTGSMSGFGFFGNSFKENDLRPGNGANNSFWITFYELINLSNITITLTGGLPDNEFTGNTKAEIIGEAHFLRAMATFDVLRYYGQFYDLNSNLGIILRTESANFVTRNKARNTVAECYIQIMSDLDFAIANAPDFSVTYRASKTAAKALKAKVLLFQGMYAEAATLAEEVINDGTRNLEGSFAAVFDNGLNSSEMILMNFRDENSEADQNNRKRFYRGRASTTSWFPMLMTGDPREASTYDGETVLKVNHEATFRPTYFMRLAEMYLIQAEGLAFSGADLATSKVPLDIIRNRAGIGDSPALTIDELKDDIFNEIARELAFENGSEWFASIRFDKAMTLKTEITSVNQYILPIPQNEINANGALTLADQNPGYE